MLQASIRQTRKCFPNTDIFVFHEDYTVDEMAKLEGVKQCIQVDFKGFEDIYNRSLSQRRGYLMMCRFFSGIVQSYSALQSYTHYMRLDDDSFFQEPYPTQSSISSWLTKDYVFRSLFCEANDQSSLFDFTMEFVKKELGIQYYLRLPRLYAILRSRGVLRNERYTGLAPYNNFHVSSFQMWKRPLVRKYIHAVETSGNIFMKGWLDANIHAMIVFVLSQIETIEVGTDITFGYQHNTHISAIGSFNAIAKPGIDFFPGMKELTPWLDTTISPEELTASDVSIPRSGRIVFATFANTEYMTLDRIVAHAKNFNIFDEIFPYTELDFPDFFKKHHEFIMKERRIGYGRWIWKPMILLETLLKLDPDDIVLLTDAGVHLNKRGLPRFAEYISMLQDTSVSIITFDSRYTADQFICPDAAAEYFPDVYSKSRPHSYSGLMLLKRTDESIQFARDWLMLCENYTFLRGESVLRHPKYLGGDGDNGLFTLCLAKHEAVVHVMSPDEVRPVLITDWSGFENCPFQYRRNRPTR